jgi:hypothetical protein
MLSEEARGVTAMPEPNDASVVKRAKELCEQDGLVWEPNFVKPADRYAKITLQSYLSEERRQQFLDQARAELRKQGDKA